MVGKFPKWAATSVLGVPLKLPIWSLSRCKLANLSHQGVRPPRQHIARAGPQRLQPDIVPGDAFVENRNPKKQNPTQHLFFFFVQNSDQSIKRWHLRPRGTFFFLHNAWKIEQNNSFGDKLGGNPREKQWPIFDIQV